MTCACATGAETGTVVIWKRRHLRVIEKRADAEASA